MMANLVGPYVDRYHIVEQPGHGVEEIGEMIFSPNGEVLAASCLDEYITADSSVIKLWDVVDPMPSSFSQLLNVLDYHGRYLSRIHFSPDGSTLMSMPQDGTTVLWGVP